MFNELTSELLGSDYEVCVRSITPEYNYIGTIVDIMPYEDCTMISTDNGMEITIYDSYDIDKLSYGYVVEDVLIFRKA